VPKRRKKILKFQLFCKKTGYNNWKKMVRVKMGICLYRDGVDVYTEREKGAEKCGRKNAMRAYGRN
jgi:hypothetical protein